MTTTLQPVQALVPGANLEAYVQTVNSLPLLTVEQERELAGRLFYHQDLEAARQMVLAHLRFVVHIA
ncbi:MAG TPA: RNA polymerase sigma factor RpoH, partial [Pseudomonas sp.]|nr:RNA polymerase sigma factor RpoH [Pseudomonas sp.]